MKWTKEQIQEFDSLVEKVSSQCQLARISGRLAMPHFIERHGKPKCDAMFAHLEAGGAISDFSDED